MNDENMERADLSHAVTVLASALRSLSRIPRYSCITAEIRGNFEQLQDDLKAIREEERKCK